MFPQTQPSLPQPRVQQANLIHTVWKFLLAHKALLIASITASVLIIGGVIFMVVKNNGNEAAPTGQTPTNNPQKPATGNNKTPNPTGNQNATPQNSAQPKPQGNAAPTPQGSGNQGSGSGANGNTGAGGTGTGSTGGTQGGSTGTGGGGTGGCAVTTPHVPDGPDGMGGCWPGPSNTGPNAPKASMAAYTGSCTINTANVTIDSKVINCQPLNVGNSASNLVIKNSYIMGAVISNGTAAFTIQDSLLDNAISYPACSGNTCAAGLYACGDPGNATSECGVGYKNFTILRTEIINTNRAAYCESTCTIQDNYFHGTNLWPDASNLAHASSVRNEQYLTLRHNALGCDYTGPFPNGEIGCSADMSGYPDFAPITHATIDKNLFLANNAGAGYCAYGGGSAGKPYSTDPANATYISFTNNIFQAGANGLCGTWGPITDFVTGRIGNVWSNNKYDNGATVDPF